MIRVEVFGKQISMWGLYCAIGALCAAAAMGIICANRQMKKGSAPLLGLLSIILGVICSRALYCLIHTLTDTRMPFSAWLRVTDGGWTMFGMIGGAMLAAWISARIIGEKPGRMLDAVSVGLPLLMAAERFGEGFSDELFNFSRKADFLSEGFLTRWIEDENGYALATYRIAAFLCMVLFLALVFSLLNSKRQDGDLWIRFMILCGAGGILAESLRYDHFLEYSFVRLEQVLAALLLFAGVTAAGRQAGRREKGLRIIAAVTMILTVAECIGLEFTLDRISVNHFVMYGIMIAALSIPVIHGFILQRSSGEEETEKKPGSGLRAAVPAGMAISAAGVIATGCEMIRSHTANKFMLLVLISAAAICAVHAWMLIRNRGQGNRRTQKA